MPLSVPSKVLDVTENDALMEKLSEEDREKLETTCQEALEWIEHNPDVKKDELDAKKREAESVLKPIMTKMHAVKAENKKKSAAGNKAGGRRR